MNLGDERESRHGPYYEDPSFTANEALALTNHMRRQKASRFLGDTTLFFGDDVTVYLPHVTLPIGAGWGPMELEITGAISDNLVDWFWAVAHDCNLAFLDYQRPTAVLGEPCTRMKERWPNILVMHQQSDLKQWLEESKSVLIF
jgi:hypothetical protein